MSRSPEEENPIDEISRFHEALIQLLEECAHIEHRGKEDVAIFLRPFSELSNGEVKPTGFGVYSMFPCITDHEKRDIPEDSRVLLGFITDPCYLAIDRDSAILQDSKQRKIRDADYGLLKYYNRCIEGVIKPIPEGFIPPFSDS